ncbi:MAG: DUF456 domain-containing protein [Deltaproteobacteria bacterium]|jgi:uncharacterized protein YqgC (DUF456 family)|nr:MAG: DUF456 domain-containing protein [Deltaproteobacteria bacterium]
MIVLIIFGLLLALIALVGCILPFIPGPPLSFLALIILSYAKDWEPFTSTFLITMAGLTILLTTLDYVVPAAGAKRYGASKLGMWGSITGMLIGLFLLPPWGMFIGAIAGVLVGELVAGKEGKKALRAGWGVIVGNMVVIGLKLAFSGVILFFYVRGML